MKNAMSKSILPVFGTLALVLLSLASCKKDKDEPALHEQMAGKWEITSFTVDGLEAMGFFLQSSNVEFEEMNGAEGDYAWLFAYMDGTSTNTSGVYEVDDEAREITLDSKTANEIRYEVDLNGDEMELSGTVDGSRYELRLERD